MNKYLRNLNRIEFLVTLACTGKCKHCQNGDQNGPAEHVDAKAAVRSVQKICEHYRIESLMTFGESRCCTPKWSARSTGPRQNWGSADGS